MRFTLSVLISRPLMDRLDIWFQLLPIIHFQNHASFESANKRRDAQKEFLIRLMHALLFVFSYLKCNFSMDLLRYLAAAFCHINFCVDSLFQLHSEYLTFRSR